MNAHRLLNRFLGIFLATIGFSSPAFAALPDGLQDITAVMADDTATLASFVTGFTHTNTCGLIMSADTTPGADGYYYNSGTATSADFTVSADAVNVATFDLTALSFTNYSTSANYSFTITGTKPDSTQVQATFTATGKTFTSGDYTNFTGIKSFRIQFTVNSVGSNVSNITFDSFTIANAAAPNTAPTAGTVTANNVTQTDAGATSYTFTIPYSDTDGNFDSTTVDTSDVTVSGGATVSSASYSGTSSSGTATYTVTPPGGSWDDSDNGTYTIAIVGSQVADTASAYVAANASAGSFTVAMDTTAAAPTLSLAADTGSSTTDKITSNGTVNVSGLEAGASWQYSTNGGATWTTGMGSSFTLTGDGAKTVYAKQTDIVGNISSSATLTFTLDTTNPAAPTPALAVDSGTSGTDGITNNGLVNVSGIESGATWLYSADNGATWTTGTGTSFTLVGSGAFQVLIQQTDLAGNISSNSTMVTYTLDTTAPSETFSSTISTDTGLTGTISSGGATKDNTLGFSGTVSDANGVSSVQIYDGATLLGSATVIGGNWSYTTGALADGSHSFTAKATDTAGNITTTSPVTATVDTTVAAPVITGMSTDSGVSSTDGITDDTSPTLSGTAEAGATVTIYRDGTQVGTPTADGSGNWSYTSAALGDGSYSFTATATDALGNISAQSAAKSVTVDTTPPTVSDANIAISGASGTGGTFKFGDVVTASWNNTSGGDNNPDVATVTVDFSQFGGGSAVAASNSSGTWTATYTITSGTINATNLNVSVTATDYAGHVTTTADTSNATVNNVPPVVTAPADVTVDATGLFTAVDIGTATAVDANGATLSTSSDAPANFAPGTYTVTWSATDATGNTGTATQTVNVNPQVSFDKDQTTAEGATVTFRVILNGPAVSYPVTVPYTIGGTASSDGSDYAIAPLTGTVTISSSTVASVSFTTVDDGPGEGTETIVLTMGTPTNAVKGNHSVDSIDIVETNVPPAVSLSADQGAGPTQTIVVGNGPVTVSSSVIDPNTGDTQSYDWSGTDNALVDTDAASDTFTFDPSALAPGFYTLHLSVSDSTVASDAVLTLNVLANAPTLSSTNDSDGDGITDAVEGYGDTDGDGIPNYLDAIDSRNVLQEIRGQSDSFLIETEPGLQLNLGSVAFRSGQNQAKVIMSDIVSYGGIVADSGNQYTGGLFDFTVDGIPLAGQSVKVVIPQQAAIPANAVYRKVVGNVWQNFVEDASNSVASAPGAQGFCPPPGDSNYTPGLTEGNWCVQLTIEDGGPNDADGAANNSVADPGGVATTQNSGTVRVSSGGGSGSPWLLLLLGVLLWRTKQVQREAEE